MANEEMRASWAAGAGGWVANEAVFDAAFTPVTRALFAAADIESGHRVLDVGCGTGTLLAAAVQAGADPVGVDISAPMTEAAQRRVPGAITVVADAQTADLTALPGAPFDRVISRFGVMFFADPVAAFANLRTALAVTGRLAFACWRSRAENAMFSSGLEVLDRRLEPGPEPDPAAPGPTSLGDRARLAGVLADAGWQQVAIEPLDFVCDFGTDGSDGVEARLGTILAGVHGREARARLEPELGPAGWAALLDEVRAELRSAFVDGAVRFPGAAWLVTAGAA